MNDHEKLLFLVKNALAAFPQSSDIRPHDFITDFLLDSGVTLSPPNNCDGSKKCSAYCANCNRRLKEVSIK